MARRAPLVLLGFFAAAALVWIVRPVASLESSAVAADEAPQAPAKPELKTPQQKGSYSFGYLVGSNLKKQVGPDSLELNAFLLGMREALNGKDRSMSEAQCAEAFKAFQKEVGARHMKTANVAGEKNKKDGEAFLAANKTKPGVKVLPSGIQYIVLKEGTGKQPKATDEVKVHYHGTLIDGKVFDSSVDRGEPATFRLDQVIPGWTESVQQMKEGSKWRVFIPPDQAYGANGPGPIGPNATLIFEIELLEVK
ncbi:MAG TPA: FKBP-type peptidyl-prolyl cis-trans isomerase [Planctomycetaceae bacterium]|jgi:FKBP-type peptidyl-prolyl cis-trans isomerase|nr:FKBP-type peptidyl-prolyl cis-trans isomerase [Planctomycetaceae bacterium]